MPGVPKEAELVAAAVRGEQNAFEHLFDANVARIRRTGRAILKTEVDLDDLVQDVYLLARKGMKGFRGESRFSTWITTISIRHSVALLKARSTTYLEDLPADQDLASIERSAELTETRLLLSQLMTGLPTETLHVLEFRLQGLSDKQIASVSALPIRAVRGRVQRGIEAMREKYRQAPEQFVSPSSLMFGKALLRPEGTEMAASSRNRKPRAKVPTDGLPDRPIDSTNRVTEVPVAGPAKELPSFSFDDLVAEVARLDYLGLIEARREFEAEIVHEAERRLRSSIRSLLTGGDLDHEQEMFRRLVQAIAIEPGVQEDLARLQKLPMGVHSRKVRLWYVENVGQRLLSRTVDEVLQEAQLKTPVSTSGGTA